MPKIIRSMSVGHTFDQIFDLVSDVGRYPEFVKWVRAMRITQDTEADGGREFTAQAAVGFKGFSETFTTRVETHRTRGTVRAVLVRGPFRTLWTEWTIRSLSEAHCEFDLVIEYDFNNPILRFAAAANQNLAAERITESFIREAKRRYGPQSVS